LAIVRQHQYTLPSYFADTDIAEDAQRRRQQLREARLHRRLETGNHGRSSHSGAGSSGHSSMGGFDAQ
jgi:hypothetical protein